MFEQKKKSEIMPGTSCEATFPVSYPFYAVWEMTLEIADLLLRFMEQQRTGQH